MKQREILIAEQCGKLDRLKEFEGKILLIQNIVFDSSADGVSMDLNGWIDKISQVIICPKYHIKEIGMDYIKRQQIIIRDLMLLGREYDLKPSGDSIEDYGEHIYMIFNCGQSWRE